MQSSTPLLVTRTDSSGKGFETGEKRTGHNLKRMTELLWIQQKNWLEPIRPKMTGDLTPSRPRASLCTRGVTLAYITHPQAS